MGLGFGVAIQRALVDEGFERLVIPWAQLGLFPGPRRRHRSARGRGPGRRAAQVDILRAIATE